jgi:hypothetical protein
MVDQLLAEQREFTLHLRAGCQKAEGVVVLGSSPRIGDQLIKADHPSSVP